MTDAKKLQLQEETAKDAEMQCLQETIMNGWPEDHSKCQQELLPYLGYQDEMCIADGLIMKGTRKVSPQKLRQEMLEKLHVGHLSIEKCHRRARTAIFWHGQNKDIDDIVSSCGVCQKYQPSQPAEPLQPHPMPVQPGIKVGADFCSITSKNYLKTVDYFTNMPDVYEIQQQTSCAIIKALTHLFAKDGVPFELFTDNEPCFASREFAQFTREWDFRHTTPSPLFSQSNS